MRVYEPDDWAAFIAFLYAFMIRQSKRPNFMSIRLEWRLELEAIALLGWRPSGGHRRS